MIKGIVKLSEQALDFAAVQLATVNTGGISEFNQLYRDKFAELIIQECCNAADDWYQNHNDIHWDPAQHIRNHFGVE